MLTAPAMTLLFLGVVFSLGAAFMWMFWEVEQIKQRRNRGRFREVARRPHQNGPR
ncbi:MAG: hypothetical protein JWR80_8467 [Bradyrhizobium sp.]|nr:hypothetical protein [Bradyrhizobium sp.]